jgi:hypothetical protein
LDSAEKTISDKELVSRVHAGDQDAMGALYDRYSPLVYAVGLRVLADTGAAEDVLQEVFMQRFSAPDCLGKTSGWTDASGHVGFVVGPQQTASADSTASCWLRPYLPEPLL